MSSSIKGFEGYVDGGIYVRAIISKKRKVTFVFSEDKSGLVEANINTRYAAVSNAISRFEDENPDYEITGTVFPGKNFFIARFQRIL